jgi:hypothetical protein
VVLVLRLPRLAVRRPVERNLQKERRRLPSMARAGPANFLRRVPVVRIRMLFNPVLHLQASKHHSYSTKGGN